MNHTLRKYLDQDKITEMDIRLLKGFYVKDKYELEDVSTKMERKTNQTLALNLTDQTTKKMVEVARH